MNPPQLCDECPWRGKCTSDEVCWLEVELDDDSTKMAPEPEEAEEE